MPNILQKNPEKGPKNPKRDPENPEIMIEKLADTLYRYYHNGIIFLGFIILWSLYWSLTFWTEVSIGV